MLPEKVALYNFTDNSLVSHFCERKIWEDKKKGGCMVTWIERLETFSWDTYLIAGEFEDGV